MTSNMDLGMGALSERMGIELVEARPGRVELRMPVEGNTQPYGLLHGGASAVLAEQAGSIAAALHAGPENIVVGVDMSCTHHRGAREGTLTAVATPLSEGRTVCTYDFRVSDDAGRPVATGRLTCLVRPMPGA